MKDHWKCSYAEKMFFEVEIHKKLSTFNYVSRAIEWLGDDINRTRFVEKFDYPKLMNNFAGKNIFYD